VRQAPDPGASCSVPTRVRSRSVGPVSAFPGFAPCYTSVTIKVWRRLAAYARHVFISHVLSIAALQGPSQVGVYRYGYRLAAQPPSAAVSVGSYVLLPAFASVQSDRPRLASAFTRSTVWLIIVVAPLCTALVPVGTPLVTMLLGARWHAAGPVTSALAGFGIGQALLSVSSEACKVGGRPQVLTRTVSIGAVGAILAIVPAATVNVQAVALAVSCASIGTGVLAVVMTCQVLRVAPRAILLAILQVLAAAAAAASCGEAILNADGGRHAGGFLVCAEVTSTVFGAYAALIAVSWMLRRPESICSSLRS
jgi:O-antigen/teichoic acid export membrane protein